MLRKQKSLYLHVDMSDEDSAVHRVISTLLNLTEDGIWYKEFFKHPFL